MKKINIIICSLVVLLLTPGCSVTPSKSTFEEAIFNHFKDLNYKVLTMNIESIKEIPLSEKQYMGTAAYIVHVSSLVLETKSSTYTKDEHLSFNDVKIGVKKSTVGEKKWVITKIDGVDY